jgi:hypothetical protein
LTLTIWCSGSHFAIDPRVGAAPVCAAGGMRSGTAGSARARTLVHPFDGANRKLVDLALPGIPP